MNEATEKLAAEGRTTGSGSALGYAPYIYSTEDMHAATRLQIWQEIMRQGRWDESAKERLPLDAVEAADKAVSIFDKLYKK